MELPRAASLKWAHSTNTRQCLEIALNDESINAIEADILMGIALEEKATICEKSPVNLETVRIPIMAHPPNRSSDLSLRTFLRLALKQCTKHIKLDIKESQAVVATLYAVLAQIESNEHESEGGHRKKTIFLNADIFPGPGFRDSLDAVKVEAEPFVEACKLFQGHVKASKKAPNFDLALSLGFKVDFQSNEGYTKEDCEKMTRLVRQYRLNDGFGMYLAATI